MSLGPFIPPICDTSEGGKKVHYLVDGGYVNIVPVDVMAKVWHPETIIAVDVANYEQFGEHDYGDSFSGFRCRIKNHISGLTQQSAESEDIEELSSHGIALSAVYDSVIRGRAAQAAHHVAHLWNDV